MAEPEQEFYKKLFTESANWSTAYPNSDEALRWAKLSAYLSHIAGEASSTLRILDAGCGRGWMTYLASQYGICDGIDSVAACVDFARKRYPDLKFQAGDLDALLSRRDFRPYDVVLCSEVIEHVPDEKKPHFIRNLKSTLSPSGHLLLTTPRGEWFPIWPRLGYPPQPVEAWLSERDLLKLFSSHGFVALKKDRIYLPLENMSYFHRLCESRRFVEGLERVGLAWLLEGLRFIAAFYQVWWFKKDGSID